MAALALGLVFGAAFPVAFKVYGAMGVTALGVAGAVVFFASLAGIFLDFLFCQSRQGQLDAAHRSASDQNRDVLVRMLIGMMTRLALPLAACLVVQLSGGPLASAGFAYFVLVFYLAALVLETWSLVGRQEAARQS